MRTMPMLALLAASASPLACSGDPPPDGGPAGAVGSLACSEGERPDEEGTSCKPIGWSACPPGFVAEGHGCIDVLVAGGCAAGTMPAIGETGCVPTGIAACASGFERDATGWGCVGKLPSAACTGATRETVGSATCAPVGDCAQAFPPADATVFVDASFADGELDATHVRTIVAGIAAAADGATIAVASGTYAADLEPAKSVRIVGRCPAEVSITGAGGVSASGGVDLVLEQVTIDGGGASAGSGAKLTFRDVVVDATRGTGIVAKGGGTRLVVERSVVRGGSGPGIDAATGADVTVRDSAIADNVEVGVRVAGKPSHGRIERSAIVRTRTTATNDFGVGAIVRDGASAEVIETALARNHEIAVVVYGEDAKATLTDVSIDDTLESGEGFGRGMFVDAAKATLERVSITKSRDAGIVLEKAGEVVGRSVVVAGTEEGADGNGIGVVLFEGTRASFAGSAFVRSRDSGIAAAGKGATLALEGSLVASTTADRRGDRGYGIAAEKGASVDVRASALVDDAAAAVAAIDPGTRVALTRAVMLGTKPTPDGRLGRGVSVEDGAEATIRQSVVAECHDIGISARGAGAVANVEETVVRDTLPQAVNGFHGRGIEAGSGASITVSRASILRSRSSAVLAIAEGSAAAIEDAWIADTTADASPESPGRAATVQGGASLSLTGVWAERSTQIGVFAASGAALAMHASVVDATAPSEDQFGHGVFAFDGSLATLKDVRVQGSAGVGLFFAASRGTVQTSRIVSNAIGIHVQDGSTLGEASSVPDDPPEGAVIVSRDSVFDGNGSRVGSGSLPLPAPVE